MVIQVTVPEWLKLPISVRQQMIQIFEIPRSQGTMVEGNMVVSDGYTHKDLEAITTEKMQVYLNLPEIIDFIDLFNQVVVKLTAIPEEPKPEIVTREQMLMEEWSLALGKFYSQAVFFKLEDQLKDLILKLVPMNTKVLTDQKDQSHENSQRIEGLPAKKRGRPAKTDKGTVSPSPTPEVVSEGSVVSDLPQEQQVSERREEHL